MPGLTFRNIISVLLYGIIPNLVIHPLFAAVFLFSNSNNEHFKFKNPLSLLAPNDCL